MKTPYCGALRVKRREMDQLKVSIGEELGRSNEIATQAASVSDRIRLERALASEDCGLASPAYFARIRDELAALQAKQQIVDARLDDLREEARTAFGTLRAVETAAEAFRLDVERQSLSSEQAALDDRSAGELLRASQLRRARLRSRVA